MRRLPDHSVTFEQPIPGGPFVVGAHEINGFRYFTKVALDGFAAQDFSSLENLKSAILKRIDVLAGAQCQSFDARDSRKFPIDCAPKENLLQLDHEV